VQGEHNIKENLFFLLLLSRSLSSLFRGKDSASRRQCKTKFRLFMNGTGCKTRQFGIRAGQKNGECEFTRGERKSRRDDSLLDNPAQALAQCGEMAVSLRAARRDAHLLIIKSVHLSELQSPVLRCRTLSYTVISKRSSLRDFRIFSPSGLHLLIPN